MFTFPRALLLYSIILCFPLLLLQLHVNLCFLSSELYIWSLHWIFLFQVFHIGILKGNSAQRYLLLKRVSKAFLLFRKVWIFPPILKARVECQAKKRTGLNVQVCVFTPYLSIPNFFISLLLFILLFMTRMFPTIFHSVFHINSVISLLV